MGFAQDSINRFIESNIFFPDKELTCFPSDAGLNYEDARFSASDGILLHGWFVPAQSSVGTMLFCHGNAGNICHRVDNILRLNKVGISVFIFDYRGYGLSQGRISESGFYLDVEAAYSVARSWAIQRKEKLIIFGRSLGGIAAVHLASKFPCSGLILESTFTHLADLAKYHFPLPVPASIIKHKLNALNKMREVKAKTLFIHGDRDTIVPIDLGRRLFENARCDKLFRVIENAGHNDTYLVAGESYFSELQSFFNDLPIVDLAETLQ